MFGHILSVKVAAAILAGAAVATGGAAMQGTVTSNVDYSSRPAADESTNAKVEGQGTLISAIARSTLGGPGKGAVISVLAKLHGLAVSAEASANAAVRAHLGTR